MKRSLLLSYFLVCGMFGLTMAQTKQAKRKVKQIVGWGKYTKAQKKSQKFFAREYNSQGKLLREQDFRLYVDNSYVYNKQGRLTRVDGYAGETSFVKSYKYAQKVMTEKLKTPDDKVVTTHTYFNKKGKKAEEKVYDAKVLYKRVVYNYNKQDSLIGEMHYIYTGKNRRNYQVIHSYDRKSQRKIRRNEYDSNKRIIEQTNYQYNQQGKLLKVVKVFPQRKMSDYNTTTEYKYKGGHIWQIISKSNNEQYESYKVFKDGILVRTKKYEKSKLIELVDYQYVYFK